jgi:hypothetical protein
LQCCGIARLHLRHIDDRFRRSRDKITERMPEFVGDMDFQRPRNLEDKIGFIFNNLHGILAGCMEPAGSILFIGGGSY